MPINNDLKKKDFPFPVKFHEGGVTSFRNNLDNIDVKLVQAPRYEDIKESCIAFANATWKDKPMNVEDVAKTMPESIKDKFMYHIFSNKILPTTMETVRMTFLISGITLQEVTHILRYRRAVFSAECSGDKFLNDKDFCVPTSIQNSNGSGYTVDGIPKHDNYHGRYMQICDMAKQLYLDMVDSKEISTHDARYIMPRSLETYYYMSMSLKDALLFIYDRIDKQIQPQSDNVMAYLMIREIVKWCPLFAEIFTIEYIHRPAAFYVKTARQYRSTNWFCPDRDSDTFEYNPQDFVYGTRQRDNILGTDDFCDDVFTNILCGLEIFLEDKRKELHKKYSSEFLQSDMTAEDLKDFDVLA